MSSVALRCRDVSVKFGSRVAVDSVSLDVAPGEWLGIIGPNGAGKSSLLGALAGVHGFDGTIARASDMPITRSDVAFVPQAPVVPEGMTVAEYVLLGRTAHLGWFAHETNADREIVGLVLVRLRLHDFASRRMTELSGGEQQRVAVARALVHDAPVLLLDEPTSALDLGHQDAVLELVDSLRHEEELSVVAAMHDLSTASRFADRLALIHHGKLVAVGSPDEVLQAELLSEIYDTPLVVEHMAGELVVLPASRRSVPKRRKGPLW